jgi:hypothetical protein
MAAVEVGRTPIGLEYAAEGPWRVLRYADGGHCENRIEDVLTYYNGGRPWWRLAGPGEMPADVRGRLLAALGLHDNTPRVEVGDGRPIERGSA